MTTKIIYVLVYAFAMADLIVIVRAVKKIGKYHAMLLRRAMDFGILAILANILIALANDSALKAELAYCLYFVSIDWILLYLTGFCLAYTDHESSVRKLKNPAMILMGIDSILIMSNPVLKLYFDVYENHSFPDTVFFQTAFHPMYYVHLAIDYIAVAVTVFFIVYRIVRSYDLYRLKYIMILGVLLLVVGLNIIYMAFSLVLDASVVFYAVAGTLICFCITKYVPQKLMNTSIGMAVNDMNEGLILFDINEECIFANRFSKERFNIDEASTTMKTEPVAMIVDALMSEGERFGKTTVTLPYTEDDGTSREAHYEIRRGALKDKKDREIGSYFLIEDDTEQIKYMKELNDARNVADEANQAKSQFLANMSHEIRTPLNAVLGLNELILREADNPAILEYAEDIRISGNSLLALINDVLDFSKIGAEREKIVHDDYDPYELFIESYRRFRIAARQKGLRLDIDYYPGMPRMLLGDRRHITQVIDNLISNAIKYTREGGIFISVSCADHAFVDTEGDRDADDTAGIDMTFSVSDTGMGIEEKDIPLLFDIFQRVNEKENATIQGTGLGLAICKELVTRMGGDISVTSMSGSGSTFTVVLPQGVTDPTPVGARKVFDDPAVSS